MHQTRGARTILLHDAGEQIVVREKQSACQNDTVQPRSGR